LRAKSDAPVSLIDPFRFAADTQDQAVDSAHRLLLRYRRFVSPGDRSNGGYRCEVQQEIELGARCARK
jgi:hypothetical protein